MLLFANPDVRRRRKPNFHNEEHILADKKKDRRAELIVGALIWIIIIGFIAYRHDQNQQARRRHVSEAQQLAQQLIQNLQDQVQDHAKREIGRHLAEKMVEATQDVPEQIDSGELARKARDIRPFLTELESNNADAEKALREMLPEFERECERALRSI
jgi:hypothetical protein